MAEIEILVNLLQGRFRELMAVKPRLTQIQTMSGMFSWLKGNYRFANCSGDFFSNPAADNEKEFEFSIRLTLGALTRETLFSTRRPGRFVFTPETMPE